MSFLKNIFGKKEDEVPEMHVHKNEPKPYWCKDNKCWMIPGQEEEKINELKDAKKGPPKKASAGEGGQVKDPVQTNQPIKPADRKNKVKMGMANRYASAVPEENVSQVEVIKQTANTNLSNFNLINDNKNEQNNHQNIIHSEREVTHEHISRSENNTTAHLHSIKRVEVTESEYVKRETCQEDRGEIKEE